MSTTRTFEEQYARLNKEQKKAVDTIDGPVMVIAGPGTGKTTILTLRIANILKQTDTDAGAVLALTFTESAVQSMRQKLMEIIGSDAYKVHISTFHGFCNDVIRTYPEEFPRIVGATSITQVEQVQILERIIEGDEFEHIKPYGNPFFYIRPALQTVQNLKREGVLPDAFDALIQKEREQYDAAPDKYYTSGRYEGRLKGAYRDKEKEIVRNEELLKVYRAYEAALREAHLYDFDDMILEVVSRLGESEDLRLKLQERFQYILADEHQDANTSQNKLLELLSSFHDEPNLFLVGDEKQAIFRFQGASLDNFLYFKDLFPQVTLITLTNNYRSVQEVLDGAHSVMQHGDDAETIARVSLASVAKASGDIAVYPFSHPDMEHHAVAQMVEKEIQEGTEPQEIGIIYRDNKDAFPIAEALEVLNVPYVIESNQNILTQASIQKLLTLFRTIDNVADEENLVKVLFLDFLHLPHIDLYRVLGHLRNVESLPTLLKSKKELTAAGVEEIDRIQTVFGMIERLARRAKNRPALNVFEHAVSESGFITHLLAEPDGAEQVYILDLLFEEAQKVSENTRFFTLRDFLGHIDVIERYNISITAKPGTRGHKAVRLMTAHRAKGLEFDSVYVIGTNDGHWGNRRVHSLFSVPVKGLEQTIDDERRLFYVALTRARKHVTITYARESDTGAAQIHSQFVEEISPAHRTEHDTEKMENKLIEHIHKARFTKKPRIKQQDKEKTFLNSLFMEQGLSVTALNNYLVCPWKYFFLNLLRVPRNPNKFQRYGMAVHAALRLFMERYKETGELNTTHLLDTFRSELERKATSDKEFEELLKKGEASLPEFVEENKHEWTQAMWNEYSIVGVPTELPSGDTIYLRGTLDRVDVFEDGKEVRVVDYKTSKPKSRAFIEGKTKTATGDYKRQLVFYKHLVDSHERGRWKMVEGEIVFTEPHYNRETFEISDEEVTELKRTIVEVAKSILTLGFWESTCDDKKCEYCMLAKSL